MLSSSEVSSAAWTRIPTNEYRLITRAVKEGQWGFVPYLNGGQRGPVFFPDNMPVVTFVMQRQYIETQGNLRRLVWADSAPGPHVDADGNEHVSLGIENQQFVATKEG